MSSSVRNFPYVLVDVFTRTPLQGNQLAVFTDARGLADHEMQALARETKLSETTFIVPRSGGEAAVGGSAIAHRVRIFTVQEELPFAGHPTLGTASVIRAMQPDPADEIVLDLNVGRIPVRFEPLPDGGTLGEMTQINPSFGAIHDREALARAIGLSLNDFDPDLPIQTVSTGMAFAIVPLRSLAAARALKFSWNQAAGYLEKTDAKFLYFVARETMDANCRLHARMIFYDGEDPATGSAAGCCAGWAVKHGVAAPDEIFWVEQGVAIHRPSYLRLCAGLQNDRSGDNQVVNVRVGGSVVEVARGVFTL